MNTLFLKDFTVLDFAFMHPTDGLTGESWYVSAELEGELNDQGFIFDFGPAKKALKSAVDKEFDHKFLFDESLAVPQETGLNFADRYFYSAPSESYASFPSTLTLSYLEKALSEKIFSRMPHNVTALRITLREDARFKSEANFRYTHGLQLHEGNCQRLFHGHRNPVEVWVDGIRESKLEFDLAAYWNGAHFAQIDTVKNAKALGLQLGKRIKSEDLAEITYESPQGKFFAKIPASKLFMLATEPSIENIARAGVVWLREQGIRGVLKVVAYEGLNKGASFIQS